MQLQLLASDFRSSYVITRSQRYQIASIPEEILDLLGQRIIEIIWHGELTLGRAQNSHSWLLIVSLGLVNIDFHALDYS